MSVATTTHPDACPALVLNADYRPLSYYPLSLWSWQDSVKAVFLDRVNIVSSYEVIVRSPSVELELPSVVSLKNYIKPPEWPAFTRFNLFLRDQFTCQYCSSKENLTFDHLVPKCLKGRTTWANVISACTSCNLKKGKRLLQSVEMNLVKLPSKPTTIELQNNGKNFPPNYLHKSWHDYLYWDTELEN